jgi:hypothetical protein
MERQRCSNVHKIGLGIQWCRLQVTVWNVIHDKSHFNIVIHIEQGLRPSSEGAVNWKTFGVTIVSHIVSYSVIVASQCYIVAQWCVSQCHIMSRWVGQKVPSRPLADRFAVGQRQKDNIRIALLRSETTRARAES